MNKQALDRLLSNFNEAFPAVPLHTVRADFTSGLALPPLDGVLIANALHFVEGAHKKAVLERLRGSLKPGGQLILVEYNARRGNYAVPYPLDEGAFLSLAAESGYREVQIRAKAPSRFLGEMYAGVGCAPQNQG
jgi:hypothetical protein